MDSLRHTHIPVKRNTEPRSGYRICVRRLLLPTLLVLLVAPAAWADVSLDAELGWGREIRPGRWNPATVTIRADEATPAVLEWYVPRPGRQAMVMRLPLTINPRPASFTTFLPLGPDIEAVHARVVDEATGRTLASWPDAPQAGSTLTRRLVGAEGISGRPLVGVSGPEPTMRFLEPAAVTAYLPLEALPKVAIGFDALDVLVLDRAELSTLTVDQQAAIVQWIQTGGVLWLSLGIESLPEADVSPLLALLAESLPGLPTEREAILLADGSAATYLVLAGVEGRPFFTRATAGKGTIVFMHVDPQLLSDEVRAELKPSIRDIVATRDTISVASIEKRFAPPLLWLALLAAIGPVEWLVLRLAGRESGRVRRRPLWLSTIAFGAFVAVVGWRAAVSDERDPPQFETEVQWWTTLGDGRTQGPFRDLHVNVAPTGMTSKDAPSGDIERFQPDE